MMHSFALFSTS